MLSLLLQSGEAELSLHGRMEARLPLVLRCLLAESAAAVLLTSCRLAEAQPYILVVDHTLQLTCHTARMVRSYTRIYLRANNEGVIQTSWCC